jgi:hypothetical protein
MIDEQPELAVTAGRQHEPVEEGGESLHRRAI